VIDDGLCCAKIRNNTAHVRLGNPASLSKYHTIIEVGSILRMNGMQGEQHAALLRPPVTPSPSSFPFDLVETALKSLSYKKVPDPEVNDLFEVDTAPSEDKYLLEFVEDGIRIYKREDGVDVSFSPS
jgi:hypothetical protein